MATLRSRIGFLIGFVISHLSVLVFLLVSILVELFLSYQVSYKVLPITFSYLLRWKNISIEYSRFTEFNIFMYPISSDISL